MKLSITTYSYGKVFDDAEFSAMDAIEKTKNMGFEGIEFTGTNWNEDVRNNLDEGKRVKERCAELGLDVVAYCVGVDFIRNPDAPEYIKKCIDFAAAMGAKNLRHDITAGFTGRQYSIGYDDAIEVVAPIIRELTKYAEDKGVGTMTENHGFYSQDARRVEKLINTVAHPNFGALVDLGNFVCADENPTESVAILAPYAKHVHAKDFFIKSGNEIDPGEGWFQTRACNYVRGTIIGHGVCNIAQSIRTLQKYGYDGYITVEFEGIEDRDKGIAIGRDNLRRFIGE